MGIVIGELQQCIGCGVDVVGIEVVDDVGIDVVFDVVEIWCQFEELVWFVIFFVGCMLVSGG